MRIEVEDEAALRFETGAPVTAASAIAPLGDGWLVVQDDATHAAWHRPGGTTAVRVLQTVDGHEVFSSTAGTKHLKPDFEAACEVRLGDMVGVLLLGSGSTEARMRSSLVTPVPHGLDFVVADLTGLYDVVADALDSPAGQLNLEGACRHGDRPAYRAADPRRWATRDSVETNPEIAAHLFISVSTVDYHHDRSIGGSPSPHGASYGRP